MKLTYLSKRILSRPIFLIFLMVVFGSGYMILQRVSENEVKSFDFQNHQLLNITMQDIIDKTEPVNQIIQLQLEHLKDEVKLDTETKKTFSLFKMSDLDLLYLYQTPTYRESISYTSLSIQLRTFRKYHKALWKNRLTEDLRERIESDARKLDGQLFSWIRPSWKNTIQLRESYSESGIVMCVGNKHVESAIATIKIIREMHESNLPIEIFYTGVKDLKMKNRNRLESISGVKTIDITKIIDSNILTIAKSGVKPFALLVSSFEHAALIDAEVTFLKTPNSLFETNQYLKTGSLFFKDRTIFKPKDSSLKWFRELLPTKSKFAKSLRIFNGESAFEQGSGVVVLNKKDHFLGLLATCVLNAGSFKTETYKNTLREKETFWLGMEIMQESYAFNEQLPGVLGVVEEKSTEYEVCAKQLLQFDEMGQPFWFTGNVHQQKYSDKNGNILMEAYAKEPGIWQYSKVENLMCLQTTIKPTEISREIEAQLKTIEGIVDGAFSK